jgi:hypothetical protein
MGFAIPMFLLFKWLQWNRSVGGNTVLDMARNPAACRKAAQKPTRLMVLMPVRTLEGDRGPGVSWVNDPPEMNVHSLSKAVVRTGGGD